MIRWYQAEVLYVGTLEFADLAYCQIAPSG
jgi:hypothetical protein